MLRIVFAAVSAVLSWRERSLRVCSLWVAFSAVLLFVVGWGAAENGMVLYTLYFFWAYAALLYRLLLRVFRKNNALRYAVAVAVLCLLVAVNAAGMLDLIRFAVQYYPV